MADPTGVILQLQLSHFFRLLVVGASLLPAGCARAALAGLVFAAFGVAALGVTPGLMPAAALGRAAVSAGLPPEHLAVDAALLVVGVIVPLGAAVRSLGRGRPGARAGCAIVGLTGGLALWSLRDLLAAAGPGRTLATALGLGLGVVAAVLAGRLLHLAAALRWLDSRLLARSGVSERWAVPARGDAPALALGAAGALALVLARHVALIFAGGVAVAAGVQWYLGRHRNPPPPVLPVAAAVLLAPVSWLMATVAGPVGLGTATLPEVPLSPAAEVLLALPLAGVVWAFAGLWPLHGFVPGPLVFPAGVLLWLRVAAPAVPDGLRHWEPLLAPAAIAGIWHAAATRRFPRAVSGLALLALAAVRPEATAATWGLVLSAAGIVVLGSGAPDEADRGPQGGDPRLQARDRGPEAGGRAPDAGGREPPAADRLRGPLRRLAVGLALWSAPAALGAALHAEVGYSVLAALGLGVAFWTGAPLGPAAADCLRDAGLGRGGSALTARRTRA